MPVRLCLLVAALILTALLLLSAGSGPAAAQGETETPTPTPTATATETATPTITPTPTPDVVLYSTLEPSGQAVAVRMEVSAGEVFLGGTAIAQVMILAIIAMLLLKRREP